MFMVVNTPICKLDILGLSLVRFADHGTNVQERDSPLQKRKRYSNFLVEVHGQASV